MTDVTYLNETRRYAVFEWTPEGRYPAGEAVSRLYRARGWAERCADRMNDADARMPYVVRPVWVNMGAP